MFQFFLTRSISVERKASRLMRLRRICGYGAAITVTPYLLIKIVWTFGLFLPTEQMCDASWRIINAVTVVLATIGILLAIAFCRQWGSGYLRVGCSTHLGGYRFSRSHSVDCTGSGPCSYDPGSRSRCRRLLDI